jgi:hypothetical protein
MTLRLYDQNCTQAALRKSVSNTRIPTAPASRLIDIEAIARKHDFRSFLFLCTVGKRLSSVVQLLLLPHTVTFDNNTALPFVQASIHHSIYTRIDHPLPTFRFV